MKISEIVSLKEIEKFKKNLETNMQEKIDCADLEKDFLKNINDIDHETEIMRRFVDEKLDDKLCSLILEANTIEIANRFGYLINGYAENKHRKEIMASLTVALKKCRALECCVYVKILEIICEVAKKPVCIQAIINYKYSHDCNEEVIKATRTLCIKRKLLIDKRILEITKVNLENVSKLEIKELVNAYLKSSYKQGLVAVIKVCNEENKQNLDIQVKIINYLIRENLFDILILVLEESKLNHVFKVYMQYAYKYYLDRNMQEEIKEYFREEKVKKYLAHEMKTFKKDYYQKHVIKHIKADKKVCVGYFTNYKLEDVLNSIEEPDYTYMDQHDKYIKKIDNVGYSYNENGVRVTCDYLHVVVMHCSKLLVSAYPISKKQFEDIKNKYKIEKLAYNKNAYA